MTQSWNRWQWLLPSCFLCGAIVLLANPAIAQVQGNGLGTTVNQAGNTFTITGGTSAGINVFHSFGAFDLPIANQTANFTGLAPNIQNILARITGGSSNINGLIQVTGGNTPNLFLMNPNGITFGPNARLNVSGSFVATTASAIRFAGNAEFSLTSQVDPANPLLQVNPNAFFFNQVPGAIVNRSLVDLNVPNQDVTGLEVAGGKSLLLVGGEVRLEGGGLFAPGGRVELASVTEGETVGLTVVGDRLSLAVPAASRADISLTNFAKVDVRAGDRGDLVVNARNLTIAGGSFLATGIAPNLGLPSSVSGDLQINATGTITLTGLRDFINRSAIINAVGISEASETGGRPGSINLQADILRVEAGAQIFAGTFGERDAADVVLRAREVYFTGETVFSDSRVASSQVLSRAEPGATGRGGTVQIFGVSLLSITGGGAVNTSTLGSGTAGNVEIKQADRIVVDGRGQLGGASRIIADTQSAGAAGKLTIDTRELVVQNGARVSAETAGDGNAGSLQVEATTSVTVDGKGSELNFNTRSQQSRAGDAGNLEIFTPRLLVQNGARVSARTVGNGDAGILRVIAPQAVTIEGAGSGLFFDSESLGNARQFEAIKVETNQLAVQNQGQVTVSGIGLGAPGDLRIEAGSILLSDQGRLTAITKSGRGGNMAIQVQDQLLMRFNSEISTSAEGPGDGGNIDIQAPNGFVIAVLNENSDIVASAIGGTGGAATATAAGVFGFRQFIDRRTSESDFTASSELGLDGILDINTQDRELLEALPIDLVDPQIPQGCQAIRARADQNKFIVTGRGGLPSTPGAVLSGDAIQVDLVTRQPQTQRDATPMSSSPVVRSTQETFVEAQRWVVGEDGTVVLVASAPGYTAQYTGQPTLDRCS